MKEYSPVPEDPMASGNNTPSLQYRPVLYAKNIPWFRFWGLEFRVWG